ncbi:MAG: helix-turn-helix transcriptional regulator [Chloroflexota bacterium]|nr:helix-turn-helix transcriptional regulator [Chloroflexota bacterium]
MRSGTFRLKGIFLLSRAKENGVENRHQLAMKSNISHQSIYKIFDGEPMKQINLRVLSRLLILGVGYTPEELMNVKFGDIFEYVDEEEYGTAE